MKNFLDPILLNFSPGRTASRKKGRRAQLLHDAEMLTYYRRLGLLESAFSYKTGQRAK